MLYYIDFISELYTIGLSNFPFLYLLLISISMPEYL